MDIWDEIAYHSLWPIALCYDICTTTGTGTVPPQRCALVQTMLEHSFGIGYAGASTCCIGFRMADCNSAGYTAPLLWDALLTTVV